MCPINTSWGIGSAGNNTGCSSRGPELNSNNYIGGSQPSLMSSDALFCCAGVLAHKIFIH
ncbi:rCG34594 [Rattus norvegicus]|uniref:RCG34594 n=1 Tax=Rattus norvegicus TaxID=10116 RepID=A6HKK0_RAT|nr:rCG34594 [Rattus norvegicus]